MNETSHSIQGDSVTHNQEHRQRSDAKVATQMLNDLFKKKYKYHKRQILAQFKA